VHGLFAPAFANRQTLLDYEISALPPIIVRSTIVAAFPQHFVVTADAKRQLLAIQPKLKHLQILTRVGLITSNSAMLHRRRSKGCSMKKGARPVPMRPF
jgi:hypothetical protein